MPPELSEAQKQQVREMLWRERRAFAEDADTIGSTEDLQMDISTTDEIPVQKRYNSIPQPLLVQVKGHVEDMLNRGWITRSSSAWSSPVVIVRKQSGDIRLCCDFRQLNAKTIADKHPLPRVQESLDSLNGSEWFTVVDLSRAYYQGYSGKSPQDCVRHSVGILPVGPDTVWTDECPSQLPEVHGECYRRPPW